MQEIDEITLKAASNGEKGAFKRVYYFYLPFLWRLAFNMGGRDVETAKEIVQNTFIKVFESIKNFRGESAFSTWIYKIAYTTAMNYFRRQKVNNSNNINPEVLISPEKSDKYDVKQLVYKILSTLKPEDRFLLLAREIEGIPFEELSVMMRTSSNSLRTRLHRLKQQIRTLDIFTEEEGEAKHVK